MLIQFGVGGIRRSLISQKTAAALALHENLASDWLIGTVWFVGGSKISVNNIRNRITIMQCQNIISLSQLGRD